MNKRAVGRPRKYPTNAARQRAYRRRRKQRVYWRHESDLANAKCDRYFTPEQDGLQQEWTGVVWVNPPYSAVDRWIAKAYEASKTGATVVCLVYASVDTAWWQDYVEPYAEYRFPRGRLKFGGSPNHAPRASAVVIFRPPAEPRTMGGVWPAAPR
jgi:phage N-6-adenine-methyltransferase